MGVQATDIKFFQSELEGSGGGPMSLIEIPQGEIELIFGDTPRQALVDGLIVYKKIFVINVNPGFALLQAGAYALLQPTSGEHIALGPGTPTDTDPLPVQFSDCNDPATALQLGDLPTNVPVSLWMRRTTPPGLTDFDEDIPAFFQLAIRGLTS